MTYNKYAVFTFDLTVARDKEEVDVEKELGVHAEKLEVIKCDDTAYIVLNSRDKSPIPLTPGFKIEDFVIRRFYLINSPSATSGAQLVLIVYGEEK